MSVRKEIREALASWREVRQAVQAAKRDGEITPAERAEIKREIGEALEETAEAVGASATGVAELREVLDRVL